MVKNKYPIYVLSKGRYENCLTVKMLIKDKVEFFLIIESQEYDQYKTRYPEAKIIILPREVSGRGAIPIRNWIWEHSIQNGHKWHWELDDNIYHILRYYKQKRIYCDCNYAFKVVEDFTDRYENIAISGMNYSMFCMSNKLPPFYLNCHVYSCMLIRNDIKYRWRGEYNADTDLCLQVLSGNWCTVNVNAFMIRKAQTMVIKGGNTDKYQNDGRLKMAKTLERQWPGVVTVVRKFKRPQHHIKDNWRCFTTPLKLKSEIDLKKLETNNYGMELKAKKEIKSEQLKKLYGES